MAKQSPIAEAIKSTLPPVVAEAPAVAEEAAPPVIDYVCGLRKVGPSRYVVVSGLVKDGVPDLRVENVAQPINNAADELRAEFQRLVEFIP